VLMQDEYMELIWKTFEDKVRAVLPLFETEVKGTVMLNRLMSNLMAGDA
jgi:hypothetical protein